MKIIEYQRTQPFGVAIQAVLVVLCGLTLSYLVAQVPALFLLAGLAAVAYFILFLQRPDLGLLTLLVIRPSTDVAIWLMGFATRVTPVANLTPNAGLILILMSCGIAYVLIRRVPFLSLPGGVLLILFQLAGLVAMLRSESRISSMNEWLAVASTAVAYALAAHLFRTPRQIQRVIDVLALSFITPAIFGLHQFATGMGFSGIYRVNGTFGTPPGFAVYLVLTLAVFMGQFLVHSGVRRLFALVIIITSGGLLIATYTRGAWAGALAALFVIAILRKRLFLLLILVAVMLSARMIPSIDARLQDVTRSKSTLYDREFLWQSTFDEWLTITAEPGSNIATLVNRLGGLGPRSQEMITARTAYRETTLAHNNYLRIAVEYGIFGLVIYLVLTLVITLSAYRTLQRCTDKRLSGVTTSFIALVVGYLIAGLTDNHFGNTGVEIAYWTLAGLTVAIARLHLQPEARSPAA